ncbi:ATP-binding response regulator [Synoicihabitans lomoniglobus]|uniref:histidine kinase n=1 Tax=Synoicihabitans lomoniglobus TaxID=2909285 RepID=A0AAF0CPB0_9BACT|nr:hybrid sensor histidine kinase/response regulator [Opitutaceae bacterium LMO-M01]WED63799.1 hybrid sensor histidine kinase/response regulator [Opitutaceae bacterium LMO-M01]
MSSILLIDDDENLLTLLSELFGIEGFRVISASDGEQGLRLARAHRPDIIVSDIRMPGLDGHEALAAVRATPGLEDTPIILITGEADFVDMRKGMEGGADDYIPKPFDSQKLLDTVQKHLDRAARRRDAASQELRSLRRSLSAILPDDMIEPLHEIIGCASVIEIDAEVMPASELKDFARNIIASAESLNRRIESFMIFSHLEAGSLKLALSADSPIHDLVRHAAEQVARRHRRVETLRLDLEQVRAPIARDLLAKAIIELVSNACRYSIKTEPIDVKLTSTPDDFTITVTDHGMGIGEDKLAALQDEEKPAHGYGLTLARRLTHAMGGDWVLDNQPKVGVTAKLTFPRSPQS